MLPRKSGPLPNGTSGRRIIGFRKSRCCYISKVMDESNCTFFRTGTIAALFLVDFIRVFRFSLNVPPSTPAVYKRHQKSASILITCVWCFH